MTGLRRWMFRSSAAIALSWAAAAAAIPPTFPTVVRLAVWVDPVRHDGFGATFDSLFIPRLAAHGFVATDEAPPPAPDSVYCRLFRFDALDEAHDAIRRVGVDTLLLADLRQLAERFGTTRGRYLAPGDLDPTLTELRIELPGGARAVDLYDSVTTLGPGRGYDMAAEIGHWRVFDASGGLLSATVMDMAQDRGGNIWFATWGGGVARFDGQQWATWTTADGLPSNDVVDIHEDRRGHIWIATGGTSHEMRGGGVARFDGERWRTWSTADGLPSDYVATIGEDGDGNLWFGSCGWSGDRGVSRFDGAGFTVYTEDDGLLSDCVSDIDVDRAGRLCLASGEGLSCFDGNAWEAHPLPKPLGGDGNANRASMARTSDGVLWIQRSMWRPNPSPGLWSFDGRHLGQHASPFRDRVSQPTLMVDGQDRIWLGAFTAGAYAPSGDGWTHLGVEDGLPSDRVRAFLEDREGYLWIATSAGVARWDRTLTAYRWPSRDGPVEDRILVDEAGDLWLGSDEVGLFHHDDDGFRVYDGRDGLGTETYVEGADASGQVWIWVAGNPTGGGARAIAGRTVTHYSGPKFPAYLETADGDRWWTQPFSPLWREQPGRMRRYTVADGLPEAYTWDTAVGPDGRLWIGTAGAGVLRLDDETFTRYTTADGLAHDSVYRLLWDRDGDLWLGTDGGGVSRFDGEHFTSYGPLEGLSGTWVTDILQDRRGDLWFATAGGGLSRFDGEVFQSFTREDGLPGHFIHSIAEDGNGDIWITSPSKLTRFRPPAPVPPPVFVDAVVAEGRHAAVDELSISSTVRLVAFEFHAVSHKTRPGAMVYRYRLTGADADWRTTRDTRVEYEDLPAGDYTFEVVAVDRDLVRSAAPAIVRLRVHHPYERAALLAALALALGLVGWQTTRVVRRDRRLAQQNQQLTLERAVERVRAEAQAMRSGDDLCRVVGVVHRELIALGYDETRLTLINYFDADVDPDNAHMYFAFRNPRLQGYTWGSPAVIELGEDIAVGSWTYGNEEGSFADIATLGEERYENSPESMRHHAREIYDRFQIEDVEGLIDAEIHNRTHFTGISFSHGSIASRGASYLSDEQVAVVRAFCDALSLGFVRFRDFQQLEQATHNKSQFLRRMSHDLRSPMNAIIGYTRLLLRRTAERLDEREQRNLRNIQTSSNNLLNLINDILDLSRIEAGRVEVHARPVDMRQLADECADALESIVKPGVELRREIEDVGEAHTDPDRLRQVVMNLLGNATKFTDSGSITLSLRRDEGGAVEQAVADTGIGIPPGDLPHIFDEFRQVERQGGEQSEGTGLGLAIAKKTVELLGGEISAASEVGRGTTFRVRLEVG